MAEALRVEVNKMYVGSVLAEDVYKERDLMLLKKGEPLTERLITALQNHQIKHIYVLPKEASEQV